MHTSKVLFLITAVGKSKRLGSSSSLSWAISFSLILKKDGREEKKRLASFCWRTNTLCLQQFFNYWHKVQVYRVWLVNFSLSFITSTGFTFSLGLNIYEESNLSNELTKILSHPIISISAGQSLDTLIIAVFFLVFLLMSNNIFMISYE